MKRYRLPADVDFPELDQATKEEMDRMHAEMLRCCPGHPDDIPEVTSFSPKFLRSLPAKNRAMYKYVWLNHVKEYEEFMCQHPELDCD
ncbi:hypothetical protein [Pseudoduganella sp. R-34]|uniref:hypothetical protein n=1 Tax=Pseudoduganella sp. R-34 TaxID=3404062 RepID=UPI003CF50326